MTTAMAVYHSGGESGRCDAKCHEAAPLTPCDCCCGGKNHALGSSEAAIVRQTEDWFGSLEEAEQWAKSHQIDRPKVKAPQLRGRRSLERLLAPKRAEDRRVRALGIAPGQLPIWPSPV